MALPDGAQVCDKPNHGCLISYGNGRRMEAVNALAGIDRAAGVVGTMTLGAAQFESGTA